MEQAEHNNSEQAIEPINTPIVACEANPKQQSTSILELFYLFRAVNKGEISFAEGFEHALEWAREVIAEHETGQADAAPSPTAILSVEGGDADGCQSYQ